jgi:hypothetical protein
VACHRAPFDLPVLPPTAPKLLILQRPALVEAEGWRTWMQLAIRQGWIFVMEYDDHPELVAEVKGRTLTPTDWNRFGYVHAVQTSTETLARVFSAHNPEVKVFPNAVFDLAPFPKPLATPRIFYGAVTRGGFAVQVAASLGPAIADHPQAEFVVMADRAVFDALPTTRKTFVDYTPYGQYLQLMASCSISLSPIEARLHQDTKSDAKFLDAARSGVLTIASPTAYAGTIRHGETGLIAETVEDWAPMLQRALSDEPARAAMARAAWDYVREERMFACQLPQRKAWYRSLWERREALNAGVLARLPGLAGMLA